MNVPTDQASLMQAIADKSLIKAATDVAKQNPSIVTASMECINANPNAKDKLLKICKSGAADKTIRQTQYDSTLKEKRAMLENARLLNPKTTSVSAVRITASRQAKHYVIKSNFPKDTNFHDGGSIEVKDKPGFYAYYAALPARKNERASALVGEQMHGDIIITKEDEQGVIINLTLNDFHAEFSTRHNTQLL